MQNQSLNSFNTRSKLRAGGREYVFYHLELVKKAGAGDPARLPRTLKVVLENLLRHEDGRTVTQGVIRALANWSGAKSQDEAAFRPARVILQDFTGVPAIADLAAMREAIRDLGQDPIRINPLQPVDLVIDHSVQVDHFGSARAFEENTRIEFERNKERYLFLRWGQGAFRNFRVVPPGTGIVHQVNLEHLAPVVCSEKSGTEYFAYPDTLVGTDSHTTMINGLGVLGWGVGGIEAEAAMLGQAITMLIPEVVGFKLAGELPEGTTATDLVLTVTQVLRKKGVVGKYVEFFGPGLKSMSLADRATLANMCPEYGATVGFFPIDERTLEYLVLTGRDGDHIKLVRAYAEAQGLFAGPKELDPVFSSTVELDLGTVEPSLAGPKRPQDRVALSRAKAAFQTSLKETLGAMGKGEPGKVVHVRQNSESYDLGHGSVVIAAITSCTNTSNPSVMLGAGLLAKKAVERGLKPKPWVKTSLAPGSRVVMDYLERAGLIKFLEALRFHLVGFGCMTCIGNSGPLPDAVQKAIKEGELVAAAVLSGNRNFEGRINPMVRFAYLASPPLVVAYALAGRVDCDLVHEPIGQDTRGQDVFLKDIWPTAGEVEKALRSVEPGMFRARYAKVFEGDGTWQSLQAPKGEIFSWDPASTYVRRPPFLEGLRREPEALVDIEGARVLVLAGDSVTTDHISPAGTIARETPAGQYLVERGVAPHDFNSFGARRGNHEVMVRGTFANVRFQNLLAPGTEGGWTVHQPSGEKMWIYHAALKYREEKVPLLVVAGKEYGSGSSRDWAAKGPALLGVRAVIAESFERIHRSNLIGMGILPLEFEAGEDAANLGLTGREVYHVQGVAKDLSSGKLLSVTAADGSSLKTFIVHCRIDTPQELAYYRHGGILPYVLRQLAQ